MITLTELKAYIPIIDSDKDTVLNGFIQAAIADLNRLCNRTFRLGSFIEYFNGYGKSVYLKNTPIISVDAITYYDGSAYVNQFEGDISDHIEITNNEMFFNNRWLRRSRLKVEYTGGYKFLNGTGTVSILQGSIAVTGTGTLFTTEAIAGDYFLIGGERIKIASITNNTNLILSMSVSAGYSDKGYTITTVPEDLRNTFLEMSAFKYLRSGAGKDLLYKISDSTGAGFAPMPDWREVIDYYRVPGI